MSGDTITMAVTGSWLMDFLLVVATLLYLVYHYLNNTYSYFRDRNIPYLCPTLVVGLPEAITKSQTDLANFLYSSFPKEGFFGYFQSRMPTLLVKDPELIKRILIQDFNYFQDRGFPFIETSPLSRNLFNLRGDAWRALRLKLTPTFTSGKLKDMFEQLNNCSNRLTNEIEQACSSNQVVEARSLFLNFSTEIIGSVAFGLDFSKENPQTDEFIEKINNVFGVSFQQKVTTFLVMTLPTTLVRLLGLSPFSADINKYMISLTKTTKDYRKQNNIMRNDYFQLLLKLQEDEMANKSAKLSTSEMDGEDGQINQMEYALPSSKPEISRKLFADEGIAAQSFVFLNGGSETIAASLSFVLYHIAKNPKIQERLSEEVKSTLTKHGGWSHETVRDLTYMDQVIQEAGRMHPIVPLLTREVTMPYRIPGTSAVLGKGTMIAIPVGGLQMDPKYYPSPEVFDPDRFSDNNHKANPLYLPFGDGPRSCVGKQSLSNLVAEYSCFIQRNPNTVKFNQRVIIYFFTIKIIDTYSKETILAVKSVRFY
ncbi:hypothetical protein J6590_061073 [Homalodisca vitripennis]|nr:hypothetical protein J6590_061073 [Homalodisca vitripennis]